MRKIVFLLSILLSIAYAQLPLNQKPPEVILHDDIGCKINGDPFSTKEIVGKVYYVVYVDPDEKDLNEKLNNAIKAKKYERNKYSSIAIINLAATWLPNFAIEASLKSKQEKFPDTLYVKDFKKFLVKRWGLEDDTYNVLLFNKKGELIYQLVGEASATQIEHILSLIEENL